MPQPLAIRETAPSLTEAVTPVGETGRRISVQLITPGWGSSGYYSPAVLAEAAAGKVFPAGTHMYLDHPSVTEAIDRPERSVRDLAAVLTTDATVAPGGGLVAEADVFAPYRELVAEAKDAIGVSIRAAGVAEAGEAEGRTGTIITAITEGLSADFVTHAGRGGRVLALLESARAPLHEAHGMTANDLRDAINSAVRDAHAGEQRYAWVRDYTDDWVVFELETPDSSQLLQQAYTVADAAVSLTGTPVEVTARTTYVPVNPAGQSIPTTESEEDTMPQIEEARQRQLEEAAGRVQALESERDTERQRAEAAERQLAEATARTAAGPVVDRLLSESDLPTATYADVRTRALAAVPVTDGKLDEAAFTTAAKAVIEAKRTEVAAIRQELGEGRVSGLGGGTTPSGGVTRADTDIAMAEAFGRKPVKTEV
jgi:hypothetical protein